MQEAEPFETGPHFREFEVHNKRFVMIPMSKRIFYNSRKFVEFLVFNDDSKSPKELFVGYASNVPHAFEIAKEFLEFTFCIHISQAEEHPWCIRELFKKGRSYPTDTPSLCGKIKIKDGWDRVAPVNLEHNCVCDECAWIFWTKHWKKKEKK